MTTYKIETNSNGEIFVVALHGLTTGQNCGGPYKNEESAKRRIRDLKRRDAETVFPIIDNPLHDPAIPLPEMDQLTDIVNTTNTMKPTELAEHKPAYGTPNATTVAALEQSSVLRGDKLAIDCSELLRSSVERINYIDITHLVFGQSNFDSKLHHVDTAHLVSKPMGVYPAVAKKFYRQQWR